MCDSKVKAIEHNYVKKIVGDYVYEHNDVYTNAIPIIVTHNVRWK